MGYGAIFRLGIPISLAASSGVAMDQINLLITSSASSAEIAGVSFVSGLIMIFYMVTRGFGTAQSLSISKERGLKRLDLAYEYFTAAIYVRLFIAAAAGILIYFGGSHLESFGLPNDVADVSRELIVCFSIGAFFCLSASIFRDLWESFEESKFPMTVIFLGIGVNFMVAYALSSMSAGSRYPSALACAVGFLLGQGFTFFTLLLATERKHDLFSKLRKLPETKYGKEILRAGGPISFQQFCECAAFVTTAIFIGNMGTDDLAARQVANSVVNMTFLVPLGLAQAAMILVGKLAAKNEVPALLKLCRNALVLTIFLMSCFAAFLLLMRSKIPILYGLNPAASRMATSMLITAALFQVMDGLQVMASGLLRGLGDISVPAYLIIVSWWGVAIPLEWLLGFYFQEGSLGVWTGLACGVACCALLLSLRLRFVVQRFRDMGPADLSRLAPEMDSFQVTKDSH